MRKGIAAIVLSLYASVLPANAKPRDYPISDNISSDNCGTLAGIFDNRPSFSPENNVLVINLEYHHQNKKFTIDFYKRNSNALDKPSDLKVWINRRNYDGFFVFEEDEKGDPRRWPTASGYFKNDKLLVMYDFLTRNTAGLIVNNIPDGLIESSECYKIGSSNATELLRGIIKKIIERRSSRH